MNLILRTYSLFVSLWFAVNLFLQDSWWLPVGLDKFAEYFLAASIPLFLLALLTRKSLTIILGIIPILVASYFYLPLFIPEQQVALKPDSSPIRIATYNIWNHNTDLKRVVKLVNDINADVIAVQEMTNVQKAEFVERMSVTYPYYYVSKPIYGGTTALFSKLVLSDIQELDFDIDRPAVLANVTHEGELITVVSAHLNPSFWAYHDQPLQEIPGNYHQYIKDQNTQALVIIDALKLRLESSASVLACDCNSQETASTNKHLRSYFKDTFRTLGYQFGTPAEQKFKFERKLSHIDYIWFSGNVHPSAIYRAKEAAGSDHAPIVADFYISK